MAAVNDDATIDAALTFYFDRLDRGEKVDSAALCAKFPECAAELEQFFANEQRLNKRLQEISSQSKSDANDSRLRIRCPSCHQPTQVAADTEFTDLTCSSCGSRFGLIDEAQATIGAGALMTMGRFELVERLGMGAFGSVWKARDKELDRTVAVKIPRRTGMSPEEQEKFLREARAAAQLSHPNIVSVHEVGRDGDSVYIVSDFVRGLTLADWLTGQQPSGREAAELCSKIADALDHAHDKGVVHRDLKPANIMLDDELSPHIMDFGLARREVGEVTMTMDGHVLGTPAYMSPEQAEGKGHAADRRSDVYSLGVILFQLLTGELPFRGNARMLIHQVIHDEPPSPRKLSANIKRDLETITLKCLEKEALNRYQTARELGDELRRFLAGEPIHARPLGRIARGWRWARRKPTIAALSAAVLALIVGTIAVLAVGNAIVIRKSLEKDAALQSREIALKEKNSALEEAKKNLELANRNAETAKRNEEKADNNAEVARQNAEMERRRYYAAQMNLASQAWKDGNPARTLQVLETLRPQNNETDLRGFEWRHLYHLVNSNVIRRWYGHSDQILRIVWPKEADWFATSGHFGDIHFWNGTTGELEAKIQTDNISVWGLAVSNDGQLLAGALHSGQIVLWDVQSRRELRRAKLSGVVKAVAISPDKRFVAAASSEPRGWLAIWDLKSSDPPRICDKAHLLEDLAFSPDGSVLAAVGPHLLSIWKVEPEPKKLGEFKDTGGRKVVFSNDGKTIWSCGEPPIIREFDVAQLTERKTALTIPAITRAIAVLPKQNRIATVTEDRLLRQWDTQSGESIILGAEMSDSRALAVNGSGTRIACCDLEGRITLRRCELASAGPTLEPGDIDAAPNSVRSISFSPDGQLLYVDNSPLAVVDGEKLQLQRAGSLKDILTFSRDCTHCVTHNKTTNMLDVWNLTTNAVEQSLGVGDKTNAVFSPNGDFVATWGGPSLRVLNVQSGDSVEYADVFRPCNVLGAAFAPKADQMIVAVGYKGIVLLDLQRHAAVAIYNPFNGAIVPRKFAYSVDGAMLAAGYPTGEIVLWDVARESGKLKNKRRLQGHTTRITDIAFSPDDAQLFSVAKDNSVRVWDTATGQETVTLDISADLLAVSPKGDRLAVVGRDNRVRLLKASTLDAAIARSLPSDVRSLQVRSTAQTRDAVTSMVKVGEFEKALRFVADGDEDEMRVVIDAAFDPKCIAAFEPTRLMRYNSLTLGELRMIAGDAPAAEAAFRMPIPPDMNRPYWYYPSLGWCLLAQGKKEEARQAFEQCLQEFRRPDGSFDLSQADLDHSTAAYFLDLITEQAFIKRAGSNKNWVSHALFYIGQRREIEGKREDAIQTYENCVALQTKPPQITQTYAHWRLFKLRHTQKVPLSNSVIEAAIPLPN